MRRADSFGALVAITIASLLFTLGCSRDLNPVGPQVNVFQFVPRLPREQLEAAPESLSSVSPGVSVNIFMWRDFQPLSPANGKPLIAVVTLRAPVGSMVPSGVHPEYLWVLTTDSIWSAPLVLEDPNHMPANELEVVARNGPKWGPGTLVDAVVGIQAPSDSLQLVLIRGASIARTD